MSQHTRRTGHPALALAATVFLIPLVSHSGLAVSSPRSGAHQIERTGSRGSKSVSERIISELYQLIHNTPQDEEEFHGKVRKADDNGADFLTPLLAWWHQRAYPGNSIDWSAYSRAAAHVRKMPPAFFGKRGPGMDSGYGLSRGQRRMMSVTASAGSRWEYIGPNKMIPTAQRVYNGVDPLSGRVNGIAFAPSTPGTVYIATMGGVWKSADSGGHWSPLSDGWPTLQAGCVAVDPTKSNVVYAGTGDFDGQGLLGGSSLPNPFQVNAGYPFGLMKSTDGGATWSVQGQKQFGNVIISRIVVDPDNPQDILVATGRGASFWGKVWRSVD